MQKYGPLNPGRNVGDKLERGFAMLAYVLCQVNGNKSAKMEDFLPKRAEESVGVEPEDTFSAVAALLGEVAQRNNGRRRGRKRTRLRKPS